MLWCGRGPAGARAAHPRCTGHTDAVGAALFSPPPQSLLSPGLMFKKTGTAVPKPGAQAARPELQPLPALASPRMVRECGVKEAAVGDGAPAAVHLLIGISTKQLGFPS